MLRAGAARRRPEGARVLGAVEAVHGIPCVCGVAWGLKRGTWRAQIRTRIGHVELEEPPPPGAVPAAALAAAAVRPEHEYDNCFVALAMDGGSRFMEVVIADGAPRQFSERVHDNEDAWALAIEAALGNPSLERIYVPEAAVGERAASERLVPFAPSALETGDIPPVRRAGRGRAAAAVLAGLLVTAGIAGAAWLHLAGAREHPAEGPSFRTEASRIDVEPLLRHCLDELARFWPMAPEWDLTEEGCVLDPAERLRGLPAVDGSGAYAYRLYRLGRSWNAYLAERAADSVTARFHGSVARDPSRRLLYVAADRVRVRVPEEYRPVIEVEGRLAELFAGQLEAGGGRLGEGAVDASTALDLRAVLARLQQAALEPVFVRREMDGDETDFRVRPARLLTERIRIIEDGVRR